MVPKEGLEPSRAYTHYALNVARLPFRHFGVTGNYSKSPLGLSSNFPASAFPTFTLFDSVRAHLV